MTQIAPYSWIKRVENALKQSEQIPLWGSPPDFSWEKCSSQLAKQLEISHLKISHRKTEWLKNNQLLLGFGHEPYVLPLALSPLPYPVYWVMAKEDMVYLSTILLTKQQDIKGFADKSYKEGFYLFSCLKIMETLQSLQAFADLVPKIFESTSLPETGAFGIDISISFDDHQCSARLLCSQEFQMAFKQHFALQTSDWPSRALGRDLELILHFEIGRVSLKQKQWAKIHVGDFLLLERCSFDPLSSKGTAMVVLENTPLFQARIRPNEIKILDFAYYQEEKVMMEDENKNDEEEVFSDEEFSDETTMPGEENAHLWSEKNEKNHAMEKLISSKEIPLTIVAEVARMKISLEKIMQLEPGNILHLPVGPEHGVELTINGKSVAYGELVKLGEALGVKILKVGR